MISKKYPAPCNGKIAYVEIPAINAGESAAFYEKVFGWKIKVEDDGSIKFTDAINEVSGVWVTGRKPSTEPGLMVSIMVDDVDQTITALEAAGSKIVNRMAFDGQFLAWFTDPAGNILCIYQHPGGGHGKICYIEIPAGDIEKSAAFYETVFSWPLRDKGTENVAFDDGAGIVSGMWVLGRKPSAVPGLLIYIMMDDIAGTAKAVAANGGKVLQHSEVSIPGIVVWFNDISGNVFGLYQHQD